MGKETSGWDMIREFLVMIVKLVWGGFKILFWFIAIVIFRNSK